MKKGLFDFNVHDIVEIAIMCAVAIVLDLFVKIPLGASGSINISMLPLIVVALRHGWFKALFASGIVYGLITCLLDGYGIITYPLSYLLGFGGISLLGIFAPYINKNYGENRKKTTMCYIYVVIGVLSWAVLRFFAESLTSVIIYEYTWEAAFIYNLSYVFISAFADVILTIALLYVIIRLNKSFKTTFIKNLK